MPSCSDTSHTNHRVWSRTYDHIPNNVDTRSLGRHPRSCILTRHMPTPTNPTVGLGKRLGSKPVTNGTSNPPILVHPSKLRLGKLSGHRWPDLELLCCIHRTKITQKGRNRKPFDCNKMMKESLPKHPLGRVREGDSPSPIKTLGIVFSLVVCGCGIPTRYAIHHAKTHLDSGIFRKINDTLNGTHLAGLALHTSIHML